jgi:hypothetical protein
MWDLFDSVNDRNDTVQTDFSTIYQASKKQKDVAPWITIFSYMDTIRNASSTTTLIKNKIDALFRGDSIDLTVSDSYEMSTDRLYTDLPIDGTEVSGSTTAINDPPTGSEGNKLKERKFFKFAMPPGVTGKYVVTLEPVSDCSVGYHSINYGKSGFGNFSPNMANFNKILSFAFDARPGDWVLEVQTLSQFVDATGKTVDRYAPHDFKISIKPK